MPPGWSPARPKPDGYRPTRIRSSKGNPLPSRTVTGEELLFHILDTKIPIKLLGETTVKLLPEQAFVKARSGQFEGKLVGERIVYLKKIELPSTFEIPYWNDRACIRYHDNDVPNNPPLKTRHKQLCDIWDRILLNPPPR